MKYRVIVLLIFIAVMAACSCAVFADELEDDVPPVTSTESGMNEEILDPKPGADDDSQNEKEESLTGEQSEDPSDEKEKNPDDEQKNAAEKQEDRQEDLQNAEESDDQNVIPEDGQKNDAEEGEDEEIDDPAEIIDMEPDENSVKDESYTPDEMLPESSDGSILSIQSGMRMADLTLNNEVSRAVPMNKEDGLNDEPERTEEQTEQYAVNEEIQQPVLLRTAKTVEKAVRTILMYDCGSDLETKAAMATYNLHQILQSNFSQDGQVRFIVMTGGSNTWHLESEYLYDPETGLSPGAISSEYNQIWEAKGLDAEKNPGKLVLLDRDGILGDGENAYKAAVDYTINEYGEKVYDWDKDYEWMTKPKVLQAFINYGVTNFPADKYDLILWDHGSGACYGFGDDEHDPTGKFFGADNISFSEFIDALDGTENGVKFDFIDFDACLMNSLEINLALADYADYYIASADKEPGYGQYYTRWLNVLGEDPDTNGFELGKIIVDDFVAFYDKEEGDGSTQEGTLAVMDLKKLKNSELAEKLASLADLMTQEATTANADGEYLFYDELNSFYNAIRYAGWEYTDLRNMASLISIILHEINAEDVTGKPGVLDNQYLETAQDLIALLSDPDMIYAGATKGEVADGQFVRDSEGNVEFHPLRPTGMHLFFPDIDSPGIVDVYAKELGFVMDYMGMSENDDRAVFFTKYINALRLYAAIPFIGRAVDEMIDEGMPRDSITADSVKEYLEESDSSRWKEIVLPALESGFDSEAKAKLWLENLIRQQRGEAVEEPNISLVTVREPEGTGYQISIEDTRQRVIDSIRKNAYLELPALEEYVKNYPNPDLLKRVLMWAGDNASIKLGSAAGTQEFDMELTDDGFLADFVRWYNNDTCIWNLDPTEAKWYALQDAQGNLHVTAAEPSRDRMLVPVTCDVDGEPIMAVLIFRDGKLSEISSWQDGHMGRSIMASDLKETLTLLPVLYINDFGDEYYLPISWTDFTITPENVDKIRLTYTDISNIPDIGDTDGDGKAFQEQVVLRDIYSYEWDLSDLVQNPSGALTSIWVASVLPAVYNGKEQAAQVVVDGVPLVEGRDYVWSKDDENDSFTDVGAHSMLMKGIGDYIKYVFKDFVIQPASIGDTAISGITDKTYTGMALGQSPVITFGDMTLVEGRDYTVTYENNVKTGTATMIIHGIGNFTGTVTKMFAILPVEEEPEEEPEGKPQEEAETAPAPERSEKKHWTPSADEQNAGSNGEAVRDVPKTGDSSQTMLWVLLMLIASGVLAGCVLVIRTQRDGPFVHLFTPRTRLKCGFRHWTTTQKDRPSVLNNKTPR